MQYAIAQLKPIKFLKILALLGVCLLFLITTACSNGSTTSARPQNPPVQAGGQNNPHKMGGDSTIKSTPAKADNVKAVN